MAKYAGRQLVLYIAAPPLAATSVASTDVFTTAAHGFAVGDGVVFTGLTGGAGLVAGKRYYVITVPLSTTFTVSATLGGANFDHTTNITAGSVQKFNTIGQVTKVGSAGSARSLIDASAYGDDWKDYVVGQQDGSSLEIDMALDPALAGHIALQAAYTAGVSKYFGMIHTPSLFDISFPAMVTKFERGAEKDGLLQGSASLKILNPGVTDTP